MKVGELPRDSFYVLRLLVACGKCASVLGEAPEQTSLAIGNRTTNPNSTERNFQIYTDKGWFVFDGGTGEPFSGAVAGGDPFEVDFLRRAHFHDESLSAPNGERMRYDEVRQWFAEECEQADADAIEKAELELWAKLDRLGAKLSSVPQMPPKTDYRAERENFSRIKRAGDFRNAIIKMRNGLCRCDACDLALKEVIEGSHVHQVFENGDFHPTNGLLFCANHHRMWNRGLFGIDPIDGAIYPEQGRMITALGITHSKIPNASFGLVDKQKLSHRWTAWTAVGIKK